MITFRLGIVAGGVVHLLGGGGRCMRTRTYVVGGAALGVLLSVFTLRAETRGPGPDTPGEATASILGVVVDRVPIPADPDGKAGLPTDRIMQGLVATMIGAVVVSAALGGLIGWGVSRFRRPPRQAEPAAPPPVGE